MQHKSVVYFLLAVLTMIGKVQAQEVLAYPLKYNRPYEKMDLSSSQERLPSVRWKVYSDRDANVTYTTPGGNTQETTISYMDDFYVAEEQGDYIQLVKDPDIDIMSLSSNTRFFGWIHKSKMLLWSRCLMSEKGRINRKSMILNTVRHLRKLDGSEPDIVKFRSAPDGQSRVTYKSQLFEIYFVYKTTKEFILLGKNHRIEQQAAANTYVLGWVPRARLTFWDHRVAIEPNWEKAAASERQYGRKARVFLDLQYAAEYRDGGNIASTAVIWENDPFDKRRIGEWRRFPILKKENEIGEKDIVIAGVMGKIYSPKGDQMGSAEDVAVLDRKLDELIEKRREVNIVFVIDGTKSMGEYFRPVGTAIANSIDKLRKNTRNNFNFGAAVYTDLAEGRQRLLDLLPVGGDVPSFLDRDEYHKYDTDPPEAVFYGVHGALRGAKLRKNATNIVILIGDTGNHHRNDKSQVDKFKIIGQLARLKCHFFCYQVRHLGNNNPTNTYNEFVTQFKDIVLTAAQRIHRDFVSHGTSLGVKIHRPEWEQQSSYTRKYKLTSTSSGGWVLGLKPGQTFQPVDLTQNIIRFINYVDERQNELISLIKKIKDGKAVEEVVQEASNNQHSSKYKEFASPLAPGIIEFLKAARLNKEELALVQKDKYQLYINAPAPIRVNGQNEPLFKSVLFLSRDDLGKLTDNMEKLADVVSESELRENLIKNWIQLVQSYEGGLSDEDIEDMTPEQLTEIVFGLPSKSEILKNLTLRDIRNPNKISLDDLGRYWKDILNKAGKVRKIFNSDREQYPYSFRSNEIRYYWISEDDLP